jgi:D-alanyl-D-alanine carboxypeptidase
MLSTNFLFAMRFNFFGAKRTIIFISIFITYSITAQSTQQPNKVVFTWPQVQQQFLKHYQNNPTALHATQQTLLTQLLTEQLTMIQVPYWAYNDSSCNGNIVCHKTVGAELLHIFNELYQLHFPIYQIQPICFFNCNDELSMQQNNTSCFDFRTMVNNPNKLSKHAMGLAIDINPLQNPYVKGKKVLPVNATIDTCKGSIKKHDKLAQQVVAIFKKYGWLWGGNWKTLKDYMHFQKM